MVGHYPNINMLLCSSKLKALANGGGMIGFT